jgi:hypothetical protein
MGGASTARLDSTGTVVLAAVGVLAARLMDGGEKRR